MADIPGVTMDVWFTGMIEPRRYMFKTEDFRRFEIANREWMNSTRPGAEFAIEENGKKHYLRIDRIVRREIISVIEAPPQSHAQFPASTYGLTRRMD